MVILSTLWVRLRYWFYPIGNTPAVNLLRDTRIEQDGPIQILCLGCGDVRNLLYTVWYEGTYRLQFTCCDSEAAIIARNVVLFAALIKRNEKPNPGKLWNLYYHFFLPSQDADVLLHLLDDLLAASESLTIWRSSPYGTAVLFLSIDTLQAVRSLWQRYKDVLQLRGESKRSFTRRAQSQLAEIHEQHNGTRANLTGARAAGVCYGQAAEIVSTAFRLFWETGVAAGNSADLVALKQDFVINPLFAISSSPSESIAVHHGTDPLLGFHLAEVFDSTNLDTKLSRMVLLAKQQFTKWCDAFHSATLSGRVVCAFHYGDALAFCQKLQWLPETRAPLYVAPWMCTELSLQNSQEMPSTLDVIDTSNLMDYLGLLALLPSVIPLLSSKGTSVLYTESLIPAALKPEDSLQAMLLADPATLFLMFGIAPFGYLTGVSTDMSHMVDIFSHLTQQVLDEGAPAAQFRTRMPWKHTANSDGVLESTTDHTNQKLECNCDDLIALFIGIYRKMFAHEDLGQLFHLMQGAQTTSLAADVIDYSRATFAMLIALVQRRVRIDWSRLLNSLISKITEDSTLAFGQKYTQELLMWLHFLGVYSHSYYRSSLQSIPIYQQGIPETRERVPVLFSTAHPPKVVYMVLTVPRSNADLVLKSSADKVGIPKLHLEVANLQQGSLDCFHSINAFFGQLASPKQIKTAEKASDQDLTLICAMPSVLLLNGPPAKIRIRLCINPSFWTISLIPSLGSGLRLFETCLSDHTNVQIFTQPPGFDAIQQSTVDDLSGISLENGQLSHVEFGPEAKAQSLRLRVDLVKNERQSELLASGAKVSAERISPHIVSLNIGDTKKLVLLPYPVNGAASRLRIARKSSWVEVQASLSSAGQDGGYDLERFPVIVTEGKIVPRGLSIIDLEKSPPISDKSEPQWMNNLFRLSVNAKERVVYSVQSTNKPPMMQLKETIHSIFSGYFGQSNTSPGDPAPGVQLLDNTGNCDTLIILNSACHDASSGSMALDAHVICLSYERMQRLAPVLRFLPFHLMMAIQMSREEKILWKMLLPALVERARGYQWKHHKDCEYIRQGRVLCSTDHGKAAICSCGEGKALRTYNKTVGFQPSSKFATRLALSPLAAIPYVEAITGPSDAARIRRSVLEHQSTNTPRCDNRGTQSKELKKCSGCGKAQYCNRDCEKAAWKRHKTVCK